MKIKSEKYSCFDVNKIFLTRVKLNLEFALDTFIHFNEEL